MTDADIHDNIVHSNAKTDAYVEMNPLAGKIRTALLDLERRAHATGWDGPDAFPRIFIIERHPETGAIAIRWADWWNKHMRRMMGMTDSNLGACLTVVALSAERMKRDVHAGHPPAWVSEMPLYAEAEHDVRVRAERGQDLDVAATEGHEVFGYGVRFEAWEASIQKMDTPAGLDLFRASRERQLHTRPERVEVRVVQAVVRDNHAWLVSRARGFRPLTRVSESGSPECFVGGVNNALSRILAVMLNSPITIIPDDIPADQDPLRR